MKPEDQRIAIATELGVANLWTLMKRGLYYRKDAKGYTSSTAEAWFVTEEVANDHCYPHDEPVTKHPAPLPDYLNDANAALTLCDHLAERGFMCRLIMGVGLWTCEFYTGEEEMCAKFYGIAPTLPEAISASFLKTVNRWIESGVEE